MKPINLVWILLIGVAIAIVISSSGDAGTYVTFKEAFGGATGSSAPSYHVVGELPKTTGGQIEGMFYEPTQDPNYFSFLMRDQDGRTEKVIYDQPMPQDFAKSEKVVVVGHAEKGFFKAEKILLKCPSKYQDGAGKELTAQQKGA